MWSEKWNLNSHSLSTVPAVLASLTATNADRPRQSEPLVLLSFQWDMMSKMEELRQVMEGHGLPCWSDVMDSQRVAAANLAPGVNSVGLSVGAGDSAQVGKNRIAKLIREFLNRQSCFGLCDN